jgi:cardiolipin synthase
MPRRFRSIAALGESVGDTAPRMRNELRLISETDLFVDSLVGDIDRAERHVHLLFYIMLDDFSGRRVSEALLRARKRDVACRLMLDGVGSRGFLHSRTCHDLREAGVKVVEALPANLLRVAISRLDIRNHRKIAVIDCTVGYTGSHNIADAEFAPKPKYAPWVDAMVRVEGPVVRDMQAIFLEDWYSDAGESVEDAFEAKPSEPQGETIAQIIASGPNRQNEALRQLNASALHLAEEELVLTTPYFVPDEATAMALRSAGRRGVTAILIVPARNDSPLVAAASRSYYEPLLADGVQIYEFQGGLLHAKTLTIDRELAIVGTANFDRRSFELNFEVTLAVYDTDFASELRFLQMSYRDQSRQVLTSQWMRRAWPRRLLENGAGLLSPLL